MAEVNSFIKQFIARVKGDDAEAQAQKTLRQAKSALDVQISSMKGDLVDLETDLEQKKIEEENALVNNGDTISNKSARGSYVKRLIEANTATVEAEESLEVHKETLKFLEKKRKELK